MKKLRLWGLISLGCLLACAKSDQVSVQGTVRVDGQPLEMGLIQLSPLEGAFPSAGAQISGGQFTALLHPTKYRVQIYAPREAKAAAKPAQRGPDAGPSMEETLPPRYNVNSELTLDVAASQGQATFDLRSK